MKPITLMLLAMTFVTAPYQLYGQWTRTDPYVYLSTSTDRVGIGVTIPSTKLDILGSGTGGSTAMVRVVSSDDLAGIIFRSNNDGDVSLFSPQNTDELVINTGGSSRVKVTSSGTVGINDAAPNTAYKLVVGGKIKATDVKVEASEADFVFEADYPLMPLSTLEQYIAEHKHLPAIPSGELLEKEGTYVGAMQSLLLQKIEELTLYVLQLKKENDELSERLSLIEVTKDVSPDVPR